MTPECCSCVSAERLRRPVGVSEQGLLGTRGCDHPHEALRTRWAAQHLHPRLCLRGLDQEGYGDGLETNTAIQQGLIKSAFNAHFHLTICFFFHLRCFFCNKNINNIQIYHQILLHEL